MMCRIICKTSVSIFLNGPRNLPRCCASERHPVHLRNVLYLAALTILVTMHEHKGKIIHCFACFARWILTQFGFVLEKSLMRKLQRFWSKLMKTNWTWEPLYSGEGWVFLVILQFFRCIHSVYIAVCSELGHLRVAKSSYQLQPSVKSFTGKWTFVCMSVKLIFVSKAVHLAHFEKGLEAILKTV